MTEVKEAAAGQTAAVAGTEPEKKDRSFLSRLLSWDWGKDNDEALPADETSANDSPPGVAGADELLGVRPKSGTEARRQQQREEISKVLLALGSVSEPAGGPVNAAPPTSSERDAKYYQSLNIAYLAVDLGQDLGMVAKDYPALKPAWVQKRMGRSDVSEKEMLDFIIQEVRHQDLLRKAMQRDQDRRSVIKGINDKKGGIAISPGGDMVAGTNKIAERGTGGEFMLRDAAMLRPALHHAGNSEVYLESPDVMMARKMDAKGSFSASVADGIAYASSATGDYVPQRRDANESAARVELQKKRLTTEAKYQSWAEESLRRKEAFSELVAARRDQIVGSTKSDDEMEALLQELAQTSRDWGEREQERLREQATEAEQDLQNGLLSVRRFDSFLETAGYRGGAAALVEQKEQEAIEQDAEAVLVDRMLGSKGFWNEGEGGDPRALPATRKYLRKMLLPAAEFVFANGTRQIVYDKRFADPAEVRKARYSGGRDSPKSVRVLSQEEKEADQHGDKEYQALLAQIAENDRRDDILLEPYGFDDATKALVKHRALLQASSRMPRPIGELASNPDTWLSKVPILGGLNSVRIMAPMVLIARRLEKGEEVSQEELQMLHETLIEMGRPNTWLAATLDMAAESASIGIEMLTTAGVATATRKAVTELGKEAVYVYLKKFVSGAERDALLRLAELKAGKSLVVRGLAGAASVAAQTATGTLSRVLDRTVTDLGTQGVQVTQNDLDQYVAHIDATERPGSVWSAFGKAFRYQFMENTSEKLGSVFSALGGEEAVKQAMRGLSEPMKDRLGKHALFLAIAKANPGKKLETVQKMLARASVDSLPMEMLEEGGSAGLHWMFDGEEFHLPSAEDAASLFVTMLMTGTVMKVANWRDGKEGREENGAPASRGTALGRALREQSEAVGAPQQAVLETGASAQAPVQAEAGIISAEGMLQGADGQGAAAGGTATAGVDAKAVTGGAVQPRLSFSQGSGGRRLVDRFVNLAALEGRFRRGPKTDAKGLEEVLAHYSLKLGEARLGKADRVRPGVKEAHTIILASGGEAVLNVEGNKVWVDTQGVQGAAAGSESKEQELKGGDLVYQAAMTYALNNDLQFSPDPRSVTKKALRRRVSHMLSSALRHGTTKHLSPVSPAYSATTPDKVTKDLVAAQWREEQTPEDYQHNLELLIREELKWVGEQMAAVPSLREARQKKAEKDAKRNGETLPPWPEPPPLVLLEDLQYDPASDTVLQRKKGADGTVQWQRLSEGDFRALVAGLDPGDSGVSAATLSRALVAKSEVEQEGVGRGGSEHLADQERNGGGVVSDRGGVKLFRLLGPDADPNEIFYSRQQGNNVEGSVNGAHPVQRTGVTQAEVDEALERLRTLPEAAGLTDSLLIVGNRQELDGKDGPPGQADYHADEWAGIETAEGFIDTKTGGAVVLRDQVEVREGETPAMAVARVVMHERVGHGGVNALLGTEPEYQKKWDKARSMIPAAELQSLQQKYPELANRPADLALEWLAHQTGDRMSSQSFKPGSAAAEMWQTLKDYVAKIMHTASGGKMMSDAALEAYVRDMIAGARRKVKNGEAGGGSASVNGAVGGSVNGVNGTASHAGSETSGQSLDEVGVEPRLQFSHSSGSPPLGIVTPQNRVSGNLRQDKFNEVRIAKRDLGSPESVEDRNRGQKAFVEKFYDKAAYEGVMRNLKDNVVFLAMPSSSGKNHIPYYLARKLKSDFGGAALNASAYMSRSRATESKKNRSYLAKMAMPDFEIKNEAFKDLVKGKKVVLVDDIVTTGDSIDTVAHMLRRNGVEVVHVAALAAHRDGLSIESRTVDQTAAKLKALLVGHPDVLGDSELNRVVNDDKAMHDLIMGAHGGSRNSLLERALEDATSKEKALEVLNAIRKRYKTVNEKE